MDAQQYRRLLKYGDPNMLHKDYKGIEWAKEELERIKKIVDLEEQVKEAKIIWEICDQVHRLMYNPPSGVEKNEPYGLNTLILLLDSLLSLKIKTTKSNSAKNKNNSACQYCQKKLFSPYVWNDKNFCNQYCLNKWKLPCDECGNSRQGKNLQRSDQDDGKRFCSHECFNNHYAEICDKCQQKALGKTYYNDYVNKTGVLCSACHLKKTKEQKSETESILKDLRKKLLDAYNTLQKEAEQQPPVSFFEIFDLSLVMKSKSYQSSKDMEVNCKALLCEQLKEKELADELETYVQQKLAEIKQIRQSKLVNGKNDDKNIPYQSNSSGLDDNRENSGNVNNDNHRERERERAITTIYY